MNLAKTMLIAFAAGAGMVVAGFTIAVAIILWEIHVGDQP